MNQRTYRVAVAAFLFTTIVAIAVLYSWRPGQALAARR